MSKCNNHWCEHYGEQSGKCKVCKEHETEKDCPDLRVRFQRTQIEQLEILRPDKGQSQGQQR